MRFIKTRRQHHAEFVVAAHVVPYNHTTTPDAAFCSSTLPLPATRTERHARFVKNIVVASSFAEWSCSLGWTISTTALSSAVKKLSVAKKSQIFVLQ